MVSLTGKLAWFSIGVLVGFFLLAIVTAPTKLTTRPAEWNDIEQK